MKFRSFYEKHEEQEKDESISLSHIYETKSDGISRKNSNASIDEMMPCENSESSEE